MPMKRRPTILHLLYATAMLASSWALAGMLIGTMLGAIVLTFWAVVVYSKPGSWAEAIVVIFILLVLIGLMLPPGF